MQNCAKQRTSTCRPASFEVAFCTVTRVTTLAASLSTMCEWPSSHHREGCFKCTRLAYHHFLPIRSSPSVGYDAGVSPSELSSCLPCPLVLPFSQQAVKKIDSFQVKPLAIQTLQTPPGGAWRAPQPARLAAAPCVSGSLPSDGPLMAIGTNIALLLRAKGGTNFLAHT